MGLDRDKEDDRLFDAVFEAFLAEKRLATGVFFSRNGLVKDF